MKKNASSFLLLTLGLLITIILFDYSSLYSQAVKKEKIKYGESKSIVSQRPNKFTKFLKSRVDEGKEKFDEPQMFALINRLMRTKDGSAAPTYKPNYKMTELMKLKQNSFSMKKTQSLNWVERGPGNVGGRTRGIVVDPGDPTKNTWYVGSVSGGVWKTTNAGASWRHLTEEVPNLATTTIAQSKSNPNVIYVGTGEGYFNADAVMGDGILKSTDRGETWTQLSSTATNPDFSYVNRVIVDFNNENIVIAGTNNGIFKSTDGGATWFKKYSASGSVQQVVANPLNFNTLYASDNGKGIMKSTNAGETWFATDNASLSGSRFEFAIAPSDTNVLYVSAETGVGGVLYGTSNGGQKWQKIDIASGTDVDWLNGQGWYDNTIDINPYDAYEVYVGGIDVWRMKINSSFVKGITSIDKIHIDSTFTFTPSNLPFENGGLGTGNDYWKTDFLSTNDFFNVEIRFGSSKKQNAARFMNTGIEYKDYQEVPFEVWDVTNNRQLMVSFQDVDKNNTFNLRASRGDIIHIHNVDYNASVVPDSIAKLKGAKYKNSFVVVFRMVVGVTWNAAALPNATLRINVGDVPVLNRTAVPITDGYNQYAGTQANIHVDQHNIVCVPMNDATKTFRIINGNDGGVALSNDNGNTFVEVGDNEYNTTQFYGVDKMKGFQAYMGGTQDNGTFLSNPNNGPATSSTKYDYVIGGDGFEVVWNFKDPMKMIGASQYNGLVRTTDGWQSYDIPTRGFPDRGNSAKSPFISKIAGSKIDPDLLFVITRDGVYRSDNFAETWSLVPITTSFQSGGYFTFAQVVISNATPQVVWAGAYMGTDGKMQVSKDGGLTFKAVNNYSSPMGLVSGFDTDPVDPATAYATFSVQGAPKILRTTNYGTSWTDITGFGSGAPSSNGFPDVATYCVVVMPYNTNIIWAGTEIGLIESTDNGASWHLANNGLPAVSIWDMKIVDDEVVVATHGRGIWSVKLPELANYNPPAVPLAPRINGNVFQTGNGIAINASLRSAYDSTQVLVNGTRVYSIGANAEKDSVISFAYLGTGSKTFQLNSFKDGVSYKSAPNTIELVELLASRNGYVSDFNTTNTDFSGNMTIKTESGFTNAAIHTPHPYGTNIDYIYLLRIPIVVAENNATLTYDDIAIVEPGDPGSVYGNTNFWDYVIVEASKGGNWIPLLDGYDCRADSRWLNAYNAGGSGTPAMWKSHSVNLRNFFNAGDEIIIRFRLYADQYVDSWGWAIDNLSIQPMYVGVEDEVIPTKFELSQNYPNPFNPTTSIKFSLAKESKVSLKVFNNLGEEVAELVNGNKSAGIYRINFNASNLASGIYYYRLEAGDFVQTRKMILLK
jgi:photosystem II stability/assembly factor-like uncharacterized protein